MGIFTSKLNITRGKYNLNMVSGNPIQKSDILKGAKNQELMNVLFNFFDVEGVLDGVLTPYEQCRLVDVFKELDTDFDGKLSKQEFEDAGAGSKLDGETIRDFFKRIMKSMKRKDKVSAKEVYETGREIRGLNKEEDKAETPANTNTTESKESASSATIKQKSAPEPAEKAEIAAQNKETKVEQQKKATKAEQPKKAVPAQDIEDNASNTKAIETQAELDGIFEEEPPIETVEKPEKAQKTVETPVENRPVRESVETPVQVKTEPKEAKQELHNYTVQMNETFTNIIRKSLAAQGNTNPTKAEIEAAKEEFKKNNPKAVKTTRDGYEYLLVGAKVKLVGDVENKNNSKEQIAAWTERYAKKENVSSEYNQTTSKAVKTNNTEAKQDKKQEKDVVSPDAIPNSGIEIVAVANGDTGYVETKDNIKTETRYDKSGEVKEIYESKYSESGLLAAKIVKDKDGNVKQSISYLYYEDGREARRTYKDKDGNVIGTTEISYETKDNPDVVKKELLKDQKGKPTGGVVQYKDGSISYHYYNSNFNPTEEYTIDKSGKKVKSSSHSYYANGLPERSTYITKDGTEIYWYNQDGSYEHSVLDKENKPVKLEYADIDDKPITKEEYQRRKPVEITK